MSWFQGIAETIKKRRQQLGLSQHELSEMSGVAPRTIVNLESGKASINLKNLSQLADILGMELSLNLKKLQDDANSAL
jgi:y4mF family transcriptional regulator